MEPWTLLPEVYFPTDFDGTIADSTEDRYQALMLMLQEYYHGEEPPPWVSVKLRRLLDSGAAINPIVISDALGLHESTDSMLRDRLFHRFRHFYENTPDQDRKTFIFPDAIEGYGKMIALAEAIKTKVLVQLVLLTNSEQVVANANIRTAFIPAMEQFGIQNIRERFMLIAKPDSGVLKHSEDFLQYQLFRPFISPDHCHILPAYYGDGEWDVRAASAMGQIAGKDFHMHVVQRGTNVDHIDWNEVQHNFPAGIQDIRVDRDLTQLPRQFYEYFQELGLGVDIDPEARALGIIS